MFRTLFSHFAVIRVLPRPVPAIRSLLVMGMASMALAWPAAAQSSTRSNSVSGAAQYGPDTTEMEGWKSKSSGGTAATVGVSSAGTANLAASVTAVLGYDPFVLRTTAGSMTLERGVDLSADAGEDTGAAEVCTVVTSVPAQAAMTAHLTASGCTVLGPLSVNSYAVRATRSTLQTLADDPLVYWVGQPDWELKVDPQVARQLEVDGARWSDTDPGAAIAEDEVVVALYDAADADRVAATVTAAGGSVLRTRTGGTMLVCSGLAAAGVRTLAEEPAVCYIDASHVGRVDLTTSVALIGEHNVVSNDAISRYGSRVTLGMFDTGLQQNHNAFRAHGTVPAVRPVGSSSLGEPVDLTLDNPSGHGTAVASVMLSRWIPEPLLGVAPWGGGGPNSLFRFVRGGADPPADPDLIFNVDVGMGALFTDNRAEVINNSWGSDTLSNTGTDELSVFADNLAWLGRQVWVFAAGNSGPGAGTIIIPAGAKNMIAVGSINNDLPFTLSSFSSEGPTADFRKKPDIYAPGENITMANAFDPKGTVDFNGTSFSAPHVTGFLATLIDHLPDVRRRPHLAKAMMMAAAIPDLSLSLHTGVLNSFETHFATSSSVLLGLFTPTDVSPASAGVFWDVNGVPGGLSGLYVVLTWIEPPAPVGAPFAVLNDIDLLVDVGKEGFVDFSATSSIDNVEVLFIPSPPGGNYRFIAERFSATTSYAPALALFAWVPGANREPGPPRIFWATTPPPSALGQAPLSLSWLLSDFAGTISQHQVHSGVTSVLDSSPLLSAANGFTDFTATAPNVGQFDSPTSYRYVVRALDDATQVLSRIAAVEVEAGPLAPVVEWVVEPPASVASGGSFTVQWRLRNYVDPAIQNAVGFGVTSLLGQTPDQPGGNGTYTATVTAPLVASPGNLNYTAFAANGIEFDFAPIRTVLIVP